MASKLDVTIHPLAIVSACDGYAREQARSTPSKKARDPVITALIGRVTEAADGFSAFVTDSFDFQYEYQKDALIVDNEFFEEKFSLVTKVSKDRQIVGLSCVSSKVTDARLKSIHSTMRKITKNPQLLVMRIDPLVSNDMEELPVTVYDHTFAKTPHKLRIEGAEGIAVDTISKVKTSEKGQSPLVVQFRSIQNALRMLNSRISIVQKFLRATAENKVEKNHELLRQINSLCHRLPVTDSRDFQKDFMTEYNDGLLIAYLAAVTKSTSGLSQVIGKLSLASSEGGPMGRSMMAMLS